MDAGFDENKAEFRVLVLSVALEMLSDGDGLSMISATLFTQNGREGVIVPS